VLFRRREKDTPPLDTRKGSQYVRRSKPFIMTILRCSVILISKYLVELWIVLRCYSEIQIISMGKFASNLI
jgi:hypothetical protein